MKRFFTSKAILIQFVTILAVSVVTSSNLFGQQLQVQLTPQVKQGGYHISCSGQNNGVIQSLVLGGRKVVLSSYKALMYSLMLSIK